MIRWFPPLIAALLAAPAAAQTDSLPPMSLEQQMLVRCSAAFAVVAGEQQRGLASGDRYPPLAERGKEYFVRAGARLMDELKLTREQVQARLSAEAHALQGRAGGAAGLEAIMPPCLSALDASGL